MDIAMESFYLGGVKCGALLRRSTTTELRSLVVLRRDGRLHREDHLLEHPGDVRAWTAWTVTTPEGATTVRRATPTRLDVLGDAVEIPEDTVPVVAAPVVLAEMLAGCHTEAEFHELREASSTPPPRPAHFSVGNPETVTVPGLGPRELGTVTLFRDDDPADSFWFDSHEVVLGQWEGGTFCHVSSPEQLVSGLDDELVAAIREFIA